MICQFLYLRSSSISVILHHSQTGSSRLASLRHPNTTWFPPGSQKSYVNGSYSSFTVGMGTMHWRGWMQIRMRSPQWTPPNSVRSQHFVFIVILPSYEFRLDVLGCKTPKLAYTGHATRPYQPAIDGELDNHPGVGRFERLTNDEFKYGNIIVSESNR